MLDSAAFADLRNYTKRRISYARYRSGNTFHNADISDIKLLDDGTVRVQISISPGDATTIDRVELYNTDGQLWAHHDCNITILTEQSGILYWFDFSVIGQEE